MKAVIFDLDGTLVEFHHHYLFTQAEQILAEFAHPPVSREELSEYFSRFDFFGFVLAENKESFVERFWEAFDWVNFPRSRALVGAEQVLSALRERGVRNAIATARLMTPAEVIADLEPTGLLAHICHVETRPHESVDWKDKSGQIARVCDALGVRPSEVAFVGDIPTDITSAREAGIPFTVAVLSGGIRREILELAEPSLILNDVTELLTELPLVLSALEP